MGETMRGRLVRLRCWQFTRGVTEDGGDPSCDDCRAKKGCQRVGEFPWWMLNETDELLAALAEPTEAMIEAGFCANIVVLSSKPRTTKAYYPPADNIARVWKAMLEASK